MKDLLSLTLPELTDILNGNSILVGAAQVNTALGRQVTQSKPFQFSFLQSYNSLGFRFVPIGPDPVAVAEFNDPQKAPYYLGYFDVTITQLHPAPTVNNYELLRGFLNTPSGPQICFGKHGFVTVAALQNMMDWQPTTLILFQSLLFDGVISGNTTGDLSLVFNGIRIDWK